MFKDDVCTFIELTIPCEKNEETLNRRENEKEEKYKTLTVANLLGQIPSNIRKTEVIGIAIGSAGTIRKAEKVKNTTLRSLIFASSNFRETKKIGFREHLFSRIERFQKLREHKFSRIGK